MIRKALHDRERLTFATSGPSRTHQAHKEECDINRIMRRYAKTGVIEHVNRYQGRYGDFTQVPEDYESALAHVQEAEDMFMSLPSSIRKRFDNSPGEFLAFASDPDNADAMRELGLSGRPEPASDVIEDPTPPKASKVAPAAKKEEADGE